MTALAVDSVPIFLEQLPQAPDLAVAVFTASGETSDSLLAWDLVQLQIRVRGDRDPRVSQQIAWHIYSALQGLSSVWLDADTWLGLAVCADAGPVPSAPDANGQWQWVVTADLELYRPTVHRE